MMVSRRAAFGVIALLATAGAVVGCGESTAKRSVDARTEVVRFFSVDTPVVGLLRPQMAGEVASLDKAAAKVPLWARLRSTVVGRLNAAGLSTADLRRLVQPQEQIEGVETAALGLGAPTPTDLKAGQSLLVIATDQDELLTDLLRQGVKSSDLQPAGRLDEAVLYSNRLASYAARDGVLVSAPSLGVVRAAIARRDGDSDEQLDEDVVNAALGKLQEPGPLSLYGRVTQLLGEPEVQQLFSGSSWIESADDGAASVQALGATVEIEVVVNLKRNLEPAERPFKEEPQSLGLALSGVGFVSGAGSASADEVRLQLRVAPAQP